MHGKFSHWIRLILRSQLQFQLQSNWVLNPYNLMICFHWACQRNQHIIECLVHALKKRQLKLSPIFTVRYQFFELGPTVWEDKSERTSECVYSEWQMSTATHNYHHNHYPSLMRAIKNAAQPIHQRKMSLLQFSTSSHLSSVSDSSLVHSTNRMSNGDSITQTHTHTKPAKRRKKRRKKTQRRCRVYADECVYKNWESS